MKSLKFIKIILVLLIVFFLLQLTSHLFLKLGLNKKAPPGSGLLKVSKTLLPLDAEPIYEHAFALLEEYAYLKGTDRPDLNMSVKGFKRAIVLNPLLYDAYFNLAKAYQLSQNNKATLFDDALTYLKRAAYIQGNQPQISVEVIRQLFTLWPFLENRDKEFCQRLLVESIVSIERQDFLSLLNVWSVYCRDPRIFKEPLLKNPQFYDDISKTMEKMELDLKSRQEFLSGYENYYLDYFQKGFPGYLKKSTDKYKILQKWNKDLNKNIPGYFKLSQYKNFNDSLYRKSKTDMVIRIMDLLIIEKNLSEKTENRNNLIKTVISFLNRCDSTENINQVYQFLMGKSFFSVPALKTRLLGMLFRSKMGDWKRVIQMGEETRQSLSFIREDQKDDYLKILILVVNGYLHTDQIKRAEVVLEEGEKILPESQDIIWLRCKMKHLKSQMVDVESRSEDLAAGGKRLEDETQFKVQDSRFKVDTEQSEQTQNLTTQLTTLNPGQTELEDICRRIQNSRVIDLKMMKIKKKVYFLDDPVIVIRFEDRFKEKIKNKHLLQVFVNGWIYFEQYLGEVKDEVKVEVKDGARKKIEVEVRIR